MFIISRSAIELPTGAGKSLVALLIDEASARGRTLAVLTRNKALAAIGNRV